MLGNAKQISTTLDEFQSTLIAESHQLATDKSLTYYLAANNISQAREGVSAGSKVHSATAFGFSIAMPFWKWPCTKMSMGKFSGVKI